MSLYLRIFILWIILWGVPRLISAIQWKLYKAKNKNGGLNHKYWSHDNGWWITYHFFLMVGIVILSLLGFFIFLLWFFPELNNLGL